MMKTNTNISITHHHHKHPGFGHLTRSVSRVTAALSIASSVSQLFSFLVGCRGMISRGFGFVAFFVCVRASSFCIHLSCLVCSLSVVRGEWICLFCSHRRCSLPEVSVASFLPPQFFVCVRLSKSHRDEELRHIFDCTMHSGQHSVRNYKSIHYSLHKGWH